MDGPADGQDRGNPTESSRNVDLDIGDEDVAESREKRQSGDLTVDDIQNEELREKVMEARKRHGESDGPAPRDTGKPTKPESEDNAQRVQLEKGDDPLEMIATDADEKMVPEDATSDDDDVGHDREVEDDTDGVMDGVENEDVEEAMDVDLNVVDDIDAEHFNYEDQDFTVFGGYGSDVTIEFNDTYFKLEQPGDRKQQELINGMGDTDGGAQMTTIMENMINATVARPRNIEEVTADWTPFERMGLGTQCMEFLGLDSLGNM